MFLFSRFLSSRSLLSTPHEVDEVASGGAPSGGPLPPPPPASHVPAAAHSRQWRRPLPATSPSVLKPPPPSGAAAAPSRPISPQRRTVQSSAVTLPQALPSHLSAAAAHVWSSGSALPPAFWTCTLSSGAPLPSAPAPCLLLFFFLSLLPRIGKAM